MAKQRELRSGWLRRQLINSEIEVMAWPDSHLKAGGFSREKLRNSLEKAARSENVVEVKSLLDRLEDLRRQTELTKKTLSRILR
ncbi:MAG: hypothetical protein HY506_02655 [Candidatus Yanofskybacteria bacterium]|nr:hypothetical protein [Candidatus Yanofskybacteria bacterium]